MPGELRQLGLLHLSEPVALCRRRGFVGDLVVPKDFSQPAPLGSGFSGFRWFLVVLVLEKA